ncbi:MAG: (d)CMP kinase [Thermogutta sp.]|nr:(d)CMP kinase [Thermogutta sp.]
MIITIDGPAAAGKSTAARMLAARLGFRYLDTGAMYRAAALAAMRAGIDWKDPAQLEPLAGRFRPEWQGSRLFLDGEDITDAVRSPDVTEATRFVADSPKLRERMAELQREIGRTCDLVTEGRDQGSLVFPHAECKFFLTADPRERAKRRAADYAAQGKAIAWEDVLQAILERDRADASRPVGALRRPPDAVVISTDGLTVEEVVAEMERIVRERQARLSQSQRD